MTRHLKTVPAVFAALGETTGLMRITRAKRTAVAMWKHNDRFPAHTFLAINQALLTAGLTASPSLWGMTVRRMRRTSEQIVAAE